MFFSLDKRSPFAHNRSLTSIVAWRQAENHKEKKVETINVHVYKARSCTSSVADGEIGVKHTPFHTALALCDRQLLALFAYCLSFFNHCRILTYFLI